ncbi:MAG: flagellar basal body P-ring formation chaperone FlgA [Deltaproteobacteria bacterium]|jgi:flagella basal body P-ring formation protein FlgA|nr:flagellar basal body P-ring formation chaperone FlgA [Deltaproteobacteria bacterium]
MGKRSLLIVMSLSLLGIGLMSGLPAHAAALAGTPYVSGSAQDLPWRLRILEAAVARDSVIALGEIAVPVGEMDPALWQKLAETKLWAAPEESGRPMNLTRPRLQQAMVESMGSDFAALCLYPPSLVIQRAGTVLGAAEVQAVVVKALTPYLASLPGEALLSDFRLPGTVFLAHPRQTLLLESPQNFAPGRLSLRLTVRELDGSVVKRLTGTVFVECWATVPCANTPLNRDETLDPDKITFMRKNLALLRGEQVWDGKGGPWRLTRAVLPDQPILLGDLTHLPTISRGSKITLVYKGQSIRLRAKAEALADGVKGENIPVRNLSSKKQLYAVVWDESTAVIESGPHTLAFGGS